MTKMTAKVLPPTASSQERFSRNFFISRFFSPPELQTTQAPATGGQQPGGV